MRQSVVISLLMALVAQTVCAGDGRNAADLYREAFALKCFADQDRLEGLMEREYWEREAEGRSAAAHHSLGVSAAMGEVMRPESACRDYISGEGRWEDVAEWVRRHEEAADLAERAAGIGGCKWGHTTAADDPHAARQALGEFNRMERLQLLVLARAVRSAETGNSREAMRRLLAAFGVLEHKRLLLGLELYPYEPSGFWDSVRHVLPYIREAGLVGRLRERLQRMAEELPDAGAMFEASTESQIRLVEMLSDGQVEQVRQRLRERFGDDLVFSETGRGIAEYRRLRAEIRLAVDRPFQEVWTHLEGVEERFRSDIPDGRRGSGRLSGDSLLAVRWNESCRIAIRSQVQMLAEIRVTQVAVDLQARALRTGAFPERLPGGLPVDPISGKAFRYERTGEGFVLETAPDPMTKKAWRWEIGKGR